MVREGHPDRTVTTVKIAVVNSRVAGRARPVWTMAAVTSRRMVREGHPDRTVTTVKIGVVNSRVAGRARPVWTVAAVTSRRMVREGHPNRTVTTVKIAVVNRPMMMQASWPGGGVPVKRCRVFLAHINLARVQDAPVRC
jgi:hypothetical protein